MRGLWAWSAVCVLGGAIAAPAVYAQDTSGSALSSRSDALRESMEKARIAEEIIAREEAAMGRPFDTTFRDRIRGDLATRSLEALAEVQKRGSGLLPGPKTLGDTGADLVYTPVTPCRIINTLLAGGPIAGGTTRSFRVTGTNFSAQGGTAGNCNVPVGATGAVINFVAVGPSGAGDLRYTPFGTPVPTASFLNYVNSGIPNDNIANGPTFPICNPATTTCTNDFTIQADVSATNVVADVMGFFAKTNVGTLTSYVVQTSGTGAQDIDISPVFCATAVITPTAPTRARVDSWISLQAAGGGNMGFFGRNVLSTDGGTTFGTNLDAAAVSRTLAIANEWGHVTNSATVDLNVGTNYVFAIQTGRISGTTDAVDGRCEVFVQLTPR